MGAVQLALWVLNGGRVSLPRNPRPPAGQWEEVSGSAHAPLAMGVMASAATETSSK